MGVVKGVGAEMQFNESTPVFVVLYNLSHPGLEQLQSAAVIDAVAAGAGWLHVTVSVKD